jgi:hypothetical protein
MDEVTNHFDVVTRHNHLLGGIWCATGERKCDSDICSSDEELGSVVGHERSVATAFILGQHLEEGELRMERDRILGLTHVDLSLERADRFHGARCNDDMATLELFTFNATKQCTHVVPSFTAVKFFVEHLCMYLDQSKKC